MRRVYAPSCEAPHADLNGDGSVGADEASRASEATTPAMDAVREWEHGGWKTGDGVAYADAFTLFHGWEDGRGSYDCEPRQRSFGVSGRNMEHVRHVPIDMVALA